MSDSGRRAGSKKRTPGKGARRAAAPDSVGRVAGGAGRGAVAALVWVDRLVVSGLVLGARGVAQLAGAALRRPAVRQALVCGCVLAAFGAVSLRVRSHVRQWRELRADRIELRLTELPAWLAEPAREDLARALARAGVRGESATLWDRRRVLRVAMALRTLRWVAAVEQVRGEWPSQVSVELRVRRPIAVYEQGGRDWLLDASGVALPGALYRYREAGAEGGPALAGALVLPRVVGLPGTAFGPSRGQGNALREAALEHVLCVASALEERDLLARLPLARIDIRNLEGRRDPLASEVVLLAESGAVIDWGRASCCKKLSRPRAEKLAALEAALARAPRLEGIAALSVRWDETVFVPAPEPSGAAPEAAAAMRADGAAGPPAGAQ